MTPFKSPSMFIQRYLYPIYTLTNTATGAAFLSLPSYFHSSGIVVGVICLIFVYSLNLISLDLMAVSYFKVEKGKQIGALLNKLAGVYAEKIYDAAVSVSCFGTLVAVLIATCDAMQGLIPDTVNARLLTLVVFGVIQIPLCSLPRMAEQSIPSLIATFCLTVVVTCIVVHLGITRVHRGGPCELDDCPNIFPVGVAEGGTTMVMSSIPTTLAGMAFAFTCQMNAFSIYSDSVTRTLRDLRLINAVAMSLTACVYLLVAVCGSVDFLSAIKPDVISNYDPSTALGIVVRVALAVKIVFTYPLFCFPFTHSFFCFLGINRNKGRLTLTARVVTSVLTVVASCAVAYISVDLSVVFSFIGAVADIFIALFMPVVILACTGLITETQFLESGLLFVSSVSISYLSLFELFY